MIACSGRHIRLISRLAAANAVRGGAGLVFLLMSLLFGLIVAQIILMPVEMAQAAPQRGGPPLTTNQAVDLIERESRPLVAWALGGKPQLRGADAADPPSTSGAAADSRSEAINRWARYLLEERPGLLSGIFILLLIGVPLLIPALAFNQISGDVQSKGLRYLLLRTERANIFFGRFIGTALFAIGVVALLVATITLYLGLKIRMYDAGPLLAWALRGFLALALLVLPYIALCTWISASINSPFLSLVASGLVIGGVPLFAVMAEWRWSPAGVVRYLLPWAWQNHLLHPDWTNVALAAAGCVGYAGAYLLIGCIQFERRDL